jgi:nitronate monooxygenase
MKNKITELLGIEVPIIQAPMAGVSTPKLAAAVSNSGGLGSIGVGASNPAQARAMIAETRNLTKKPFNVNVFCHKPARADAVREAKWLEYLAPYFAEFGAVPPSGLKEIYKSFLEDQQMLEVFLAERPSVVSFHFGIPSAQCIEALKNAGITLMASATTLDEAELVEQAGIDVIVAQGFEAGGHRGLFDPDKGDASIGTFALVPLIARHTTLPVVAAGGIMDGQGIAAAMALGATGVQLGTAFILCPESSASESYRSLMKSKDARRTQVTSAISGRPARGLVNRLTKEVGGANSPALPDYPIAYDAAKALHAAASAKGNQDFSVNWAGQGAALAREMSAAELVQTLVNELNASMVNSKR